MASKEIMTKDEMHRALNRMTHQILESVRENEKVCLIGIRRGGAYIASRLGSLLAAEGMKDIPVGFLDITLYRDDLTTINDYPVLQGTEIVFDITGRHIILVDDVIYTGRTIRAAMDALIDLGRPKKISLAAFIDRGHRELPIQPDFTGKSVPTSREEIIEVRLEEQDGSDSVLINKAL